MQFKHILVALLVLLALVGTAAAADSVEIRSTVLDINDLTTGAVYPTVADLDATTWAGFYYDVDDNTKTEKMFMKVDSNELFIKYETAPNATAFDYNFGEISGNKFGFAIIGFFAEPYVALADKNFTETSTSGFKANKIAKLVIDNDDKYTLKTGATLELGSGYSIVIDQIDVDGNKAYLRFYHDGKELDSTIVTTGTNNPLDSQWIYDLTVLNEKNMQVMRLNVKSVFQGTESSLVEIEGLWLVDYLNAFEVKSDVDYGKFEAKSIGTGSLVYEVDGFQLNADEDLLLGKEIYIKTGKEFKNTSHGMEGLFYLYKEYTAPGIYEIRSEVMDKTRIGDTSNPAKFGYDNFAAFFFDLDTGAFSEDLTIEPDTRTTGQLNITYTTNPVPVDYDYVDTSSSWTQYYVMGLFGEKYVPLNIVNTAGEYESYKQDKIAKLVMDSDEKYTLKTGATLELGEGYTVVVDQIDVDGNKAYIKFLKDGKEINSSITETGASKTGDWIYRATVLNEKNAQVFRLHVKSVFQGTQDSLVEIEGLWLMDYVNAKELKTDDKFGLLEYKGSGSFKADDIAYNNDEEKLLANNMYLKTSENGDRFYIYVEAEVGEGSAPVDPQPPVDPSEPTTPTEPPVVTPTEPDVPDQPDDKEPGWFAQNWKLVVGILVLIIIIAGAAYYFMVYKKQA